MPRCCLRIWNACCGLSETGLVGVVVVGSSVRQTSLRLRLVGSNPGQSSCASTTFESRNFFATGGVRLYGLTLFHELMSVERAGIGLGLLADQIAVEASWSEIGTVARRLIDREFIGKAVLHIL